MHLVTKQGISIGVTAGLVGGVVFGMVAPVVGALTVDAMTYGALRRMTASDTTYSSTVTGVDTMPELVAQRVSTMRGAVKESMRLCQGERNWECNAQAIMVDRFEQALTRACTRMQTKRRKTSPTCVDLARMRDQYVQWTNVRALPAGHGDHGRL